MVLTGTVLLINVEVADYCIYEVVLGSGVHLTPLRKTHWHLDEHSCVDERGRLDAQVVLPWPRVRRAHCWYTATIGSKGAKKSLNFLELALDRSKG